MDYEKEYKRLVAEITAIAIRENELLIEERERSGEIKEPPAKGKKRVDEGVDPYENTHGFRI